MRLTKSQEPSLEPARDQIARFLAPAIARHRAVMDALCAVPGFDYRSFSAARADFGKLARTAEHAARALAEWQKNEASRPSHLFLSAVRRKNLTHWPGASTTRNTRW